MNRRHLAVVLTLTLLSLRGFASILDDEIRLSRELQTRLQTAIDNVLGERKATILVNVQLDLSPELKTRIDQMRHPGAPPPAKTSGSTAAEPNRWLWPGLDTAGGNDYVLPGFPSKQKKETNSPTVISLVQAPAQTWDPSVLMATGIRVKKLVVRVLLDKKMPSGTEETIRSVVTHSAGIDPMRGDVLVLERVRMPTLLEEVLHNPTFLTPLVQKAATLSVVLLIVFCFFVFGLLTLSTMRRSVDHLASAMRTTRSVDTQPLLSSNASGGPALLGNTPVDVKALPTPGGDSPGDNALFFDVPADKIPYLLEYLTNEELENVALVVQHIPSSSKQAFMSLLSPEQASELAVAMSQIAVIPPETITRLKEGVDRHIRGSSGGVPAVVEMLHASNPEMRRQLLESISQKNPDLGKAVRERLFFFEDLGKLTKDELARVISTVQLHDLALALLKTGPELKQQIRAILPDLSWKVLEEEFAHRGRTATDQKMWEAQDRVILTVYRLVKEGHIAPAFFRMPAYLKI